ncbi:hypothetical protein IAR55_002071 [Kwoniella newhampshirensis]|uniref:Apurinic-apyrimidinic endonuclease 1 n=1 Tax=Kwoniella newhampshirensis TaxID=1651941 RepID=A0AAW0YTL3_9TREE
MPPRRSTASKRELSPSTSLSDAPPLEPAVTRTEKKGGKVTTKTKRITKVKADTTEVTDEVKVDIETAAVDEATAPPAKKARTAKSKIWPPTDLDPSLHPLRQGHDPIFTLPSATSAPNGGIAASSSTFRPMLLGAHMSTAGGPATALLRAGLAGANGLALFTKSQRQWKSNPYEEETIQRFRDLLKSKEQGGLGYGAESILVHGSYLINLGNPDPVKWATSYDCFKDEILRCHQLGVKLYNWHPGSTVGACTKEESFVSIAKAINQVHTEVPEVICVIENMANAGSNIVGTAFSDIKSIISQVHDKSRVRVCIDTCHLFAAGYDIRTPELYKETMRKFNEEVGNGYLGGMHLNDSKADLGANKDLHENIGLGKIGLSAFRSIMRDPLMSGIPLVLETPAPDAPVPTDQLAIWTKEIALLYEIQGIDDAEWETRKGEIEQKWRVERDMINPPKEKGPKGKAAAKAKPKGKKGKKQEDSEEEDEDDE